MSEEEFWRLIALLDWSREGNDDGVIAPVISALATKPEADIIEFQEILARKLFALDGRKWARESGPTVWWNEPDSLSVDGFLYARCVVVGNGRSFYEAVLANPRSMPEDLEFESLLYIAGRALEAKTGKEGGIDTKVSYETFSNEAGWRGVP